MIVDREVCSSSQEQPCRPEGVLARTGRWRPRTAIMVAPAERLAGGAWSAGTELGKTVRLATASRPPPCFASPKVWNWHIGDSGRMSAWGRTAAICCSAVRHLCCFYDRPNQLPGAGTSLRGRDHRLISLEIYSHKVFYGTWAAIPNRSRVIAAAAVRCRALAAVREHRHLTVNGWAAPEPRTCGLRCMVRHPSGNNPRVARGSRCHVLRRSDPLGSSVSGASGGASG